MADRANQTFKVVNDVAVLSFTWLGSLATGAVSNTDTNATTITPYLLGKWKVISATTIPNSSPASAPSANYDLTLKDVYGVDIMGGALTNRSATAIETVEPLIGTNQVKYPVTSALTFAVSGNTATLGGGKCHFIFERIRSLDPGVFTR